VVYAIASIKIETKSDLLRKFNNVESFNYWLIDCMSEGLKSIQLLNLHGTGCIIASNRILALSVA
jgi:hypothetical protein